MKILAIRGENLASLAGPFELDLTAAPLFGHGAFALTGPTGAGKSSLLDAMCLALYATTPRIERAGTSRVPDSAEKTLAAKDPRQLLRRGTSQGFAEVDFEGAEGLRFRARWSVRRARGKLHGALQKEVLELECLDDGRKLGGTTTETKEAIVAAVGLDFPQFTRSVLLAQNDFASFLGAAENERASLLEALTGTEHFGKLSTRVFERNKHERGLLDAIDARLGALLSLTEEQRGEIEVERRRTAHDEDTLRGQLTRLDALLAEERRAAELGAALAAAHEQLAACEATSTALLPRHQGLVRTREVHARAGSLVQELERLRRESRESDEERMRAEATLRASEHAEPQQREQLERSAAERDGAQARQRELTPQLGRARALDVRLDQFIAAEASQQTLLDQAREEAARAERRLATLQQALQRLEEQWQLHQQGLDQTPRTALLAEGWTRKRGDLQQAVEAHTELVSLQRRRLDADAEAAQLRSALEAARRHHAECEASVATASTHAAEAEAALQGHALEPLEQAIADSHAQRLAHGRLKDRVDALDEVAREIEEHERQHAAEAVHLGTLETTLTTRTAELAAARAACDDGERALRGARRLVDASVEQLRHDLRPGDPCAVCGATEHPWGDQRAAATLESSLRAQLAELEAELGAHSAARELAERRHGEVTRELAQRRGAQDQRSASLHDAHEKLSARREQLVALDATLGQLHREERARRLAQRSAELEQTHQRLEAALVEAKSRRAHWRHTDATLRERRSELDQAQRTLNTAVDAERAAREAAHALQREHETLQRSHHKELGELAEDLDDPAWIQRWQLDPSAAFTELDREVTRWQGHQQALESLRTPLTEARGTLPERKHALEEAEQVVTRYARDLQERAADTTSLRAQRALELEGRAAAEVEQQQQQIVDAANAAYEAILETFNELQRNLAAQRATHHEKALRAEQTRARRDAAEQRLASWIEGAVTSGLLTDANELMTSLARDAEWLAAEEQVLERARRALDLARGEVQAASSAQDRQRGLLEAARSAAHLVLGLEPDEPLDAARATEQHTERAARLAGLQERGAELRARLQQDDHARAAASHERLAREQQREVVERWATLDQLIGSQSGDKLRRLAQEVTLDLVLSHANHHLLDLARRYRLQRTPENLHLMVIDHELLGMQRSVASLSGGETFLVSLALALGLASLSAEKVRVETLFIDEGFGSLDAETLQIAVAALDRLQSEGRQIGVISHVGNLAEHLGTEVRIQPLGNGKSRLQVHQHESPLG